MNMRNWVFNNIVPDILLKKLAMQRTIGKGVALMYHEVLPDNDGPAAWTVVAASAFKKQMLFLRKYFDIVTIDEALAKASSFKASTKPYAVVTLDDGYSGNLAYVLPIIEELQIPVTVFIATHAIEAGTVYWYDQVIALLDHNGELTVDLTKHGLEQYKLNISKNEKTNWGIMQQLLTALKTLPPQLRENTVKDILTGVEKVPLRLKMMDIDEVALLSSSPFVAIGGHSHCHNILPQLSDSELNNTIEKNRNKLVNWTGKKINHFSYPNGDFDHRVIASVMKAGYTSAVTTQAGQWKQKINPFQLPRYGVGRFDSFGLFIARLAQLT